MKNPLFITCRKLVHNVFITLFITMFITCAYPVFAQWGISKPPTTGVYGNSYWDDIRVPITAVKTGGSKDPDFTKVLDNGSGSQGVFTYLFDKSTEEEIYFMVQLPHNYKYGTALHAHIHFMPVANGAVDAVVNWAIEYSWSEIGSTYGNTTIASGNSHVPADASLVADRHYLTEMAEISGAGIDSVSSMLICRAYRDATGGLGTDDYDNDAALLEVDFHYEIDAAGSRQEYIK